MNSSEDDCINVWTRISTRTMEGRNGRELSAFVLFQCAAETLTNVSYWEALIQMITSTCHLLPVLSLREKHHNIYEHLVLDSPWPRIFSRTLQQQEEQPLETRPVKRVKYKQREGCRLEENSDSLTAMHSLTLENDFGAIQGSNSRFGHSSSECTTEQGVHSRQSGPQVLLADTFLTFQTDQLPF